MAVAPEWGDPLRAPLSHLACYRLNCEGDGGRARVIMNLIPGTLGRRGAPASTAVTGVMMVLAAPRVPSH